jgi:hypothetical protein
MEKRRKRELIRIRWQVFDSGHTANWNLAARRDRTFDPGA